MVRANLILYLQSLCSKREMNWWQMKRIWIVGTAGSGKTTLAKLLSYELNIPAYHRDNISWDNKGEDVPEEKQVAITQEITSKEKWIFEGCRFSASKIDGRLTNCDTIIYLHINRYICLFRTCHRYIKQLLVKSSEYGWIQEINFDIVKYILYDYPRKSPEREAIFTVARDNGKDVIVLTSTSAVKRFMNGMRNRL